MKDCCGWNRERVSRLEVGQSATFMAGEFTPDRQVVADLLCLIERQIEVSKEIEDSRASGELDGRLGWHEQVVEHRLPVKVGGNPFQPWEHARCPKSRQSAIREAKVTD